MNSGIRLILGSILYIIKPSKRAEIYNKLSKNYMVLEYILYRQYNGDRTLATK